MKTALVTGADGFIGSHLVEHLVNKGYKVRALSLYNSFNSWGWLDNIENKENIEVVSGNIIDPHFCQTLTEGMDFIFHLAALIAIPYSYVAPSTYVDVNVKGTTNICHAALKSGCQLMIHTSTSEVYGTAQYVPIDENHPLQAQSPYSASKIGADSLALSFHNSFQLPLIVARPFNTYGPRQSARAVIPSIIIQILAGKKEIQLGDVTPTRDFNYVLDTVKGFAELAECEKAIGEVVNIGSNFEISVGDTLNLIKEIIGSDVEFTQDPQRIRPKNSEVFRLWCDNSKINKLTGFQPSYDIKAGLTATIEWFKNPKNLAMYKSNIYNL